MTETRGELIEHLLTAAGHAQASRDAEARLLTDGTSASPPLAVPVVLDQQTEGFISALIRECYTKAQRRVDLYVHRLKWMLHAGGAEQLLCAPPALPFAPAQQRSDASAATADSTPPAATPAAPPPPAPPSAPT